MAMRQGPFDTQRLLSQDPAQQGEERSDLLGRPVGQIGQSSLSNLVAFALGIAQQDGRRRASIGYGLDIDGQHSRNRIAAAFVNR